MRGCQWGWLERQIPTSRIGDLLWVYFKSAFFCVLRTFYTVVEFVFKRRNIIIYFWHIKVFFIFSFWIFARIQIIFLYNFNIIHTNAANIAQILFTTVKSIMLTAPTSWLHIKCGWTFFEPQGSPRQTSKTKLAFKKQ